MVTLIIISIIVTIIAIALMVLGTMYIIGYFNARAEKAAAKLRKTLVAIFKFVSAIVRMPIKTGRYIQNLSWQKRKKFLALFYQRPIRMIKFLNHKNGH